ncbi:S-adenosyl-L-methionine-dependent methyltransferase [Gigaspora rosea]|uniref:S-adenosyl-L-methionine-dependent methyltransferase n=1 Tax=Gigaspora rosea TaxID=44941 RepID=A0A397UI33_9GLOM|nr:S-adenosyl-L-methionine-dependent methyltransferase [Gigaspora rosea]
MGILLSKSRQNENGFDTISQYLFSVTGLPKKFDREEENAGLRHNLIRELFNGNFSSPIRDKLNDGGLMVLDVGCGFGTWLFDMSSDFKDCQYVGVDKTPQQFIANKPKNVEFVTADVTDGLPFNDESFDFIHIRNLVFDLRDKQWDSLVQECVRILKPGGYIEITETEMPTKSAGPNMDKLGKKMRNFLIERKISILIVNRIGDIMKSNNLQNIVHDERCFPLGTWDSSFRKAFQTFNLEVLRTSLIRFGGSKNIDSELSNLIAEANKYRSYFSVHRFFSQKI